MMAEKVSILLKVLLQVKRWSKRRNQEGKKPWLQARKVHTNSLGTQMGKGTLILKRAVECASSRMQMDANGKGLAEIFRSITFYKSR